MCAEKAAQLYALGNGSLCSGLAGKSRDVRNLLWASRVCLVNTAHPLMALSHVQRHYYTWRVHVRLHTCTGQTWQQKHSLTDQEQVKHRHWSAGSRHNIVLFSCPGFCPAPTGRVHLMRVSGEETLSPQISSNGFNPIRVVTALLQIIGAQGLEIKQACVCVFV